MERESCERVETDRTCSVCSENATRLYKKEDVEFVGAEMLVSVLEEQYLCRLHAHVKFKVFPSHRRLAAAGFGKE